MKEEWKGRKTYPFNPQWTLVKLSKEELTVVGETVAKKLNKATGPTTVVLPLKGYQLYNGPGKPLWDPEIDAAFRETLKKNLDPKIKVVEVDAWQNDPEFADRCVDELLALIGKA